MKRYTRQQIKIIIKILFLPELIHKFKAIIIPKHCLAELYKSILKFTWKYNVPQQPKQSSKRKIKLEDFDQVTLRQSKATVIKAECIGLRTNKQINVSERRIGKQNTLDQLIDFQQRKQGNLMGFKKISISGSVVTRYSYDREKDKNISNKHMKKFSTFLK